MTRVRSVIIWFLLFTAALSAHPEWKEAYCIGVIDDEYVFDFKVKFDAPSYYVGKHPKEATIQELDALMFDPGRLAAAAAQAPQDFLRGTRVYADGGLVPAAGLQQTRSEVRTATEAQSQPPIALVVGNEQSLDRLLAGGKRAMLDFMRINASAVSGIINGR